eukprot:403369790
MSIQQINDEGKKHSLQQDSEGKVEKQSSLQIQNSNSEGIKEDIEALKCEEKLMILTFDEAIISCGGFDMPNCTYQDKCKNPDIVTVNWESTKSLNNWVQKLGLECADPYKIGLLGTMFFAGWTISCAIVPKLSDFYGRKFMAMICIGVSIGCYVGLIFSNNLTLSIVLFFFLGLSQAGKSTNCYIYLMELIPQNKQTLIGTLMNFADGLILILMSIYFRFISKNWMYYQICGLFATCLAFIACLFIPESPKYYYSINKFDKSREVLDYIQRFNSKFSCRKEKYSKQSIQKNSEQIIFEKGGSDSSRFKNSYLYDVEFKDMKLKQCGPEIVIEMQNDSVQIKHSNHSLKISDSSIIINPFDDIQQGNSEVLKVQKIKNFDNSLQNIQSENFEIDLSKLQYLFNDQQIQTQDLAILNAYTASNSSQSSIQLVKTLTIKKGCLKERKFSEQTKLPNQEQVDDILIDAEMFQDDDVSKNPIETEDQMVKKFQIPNKIEKSKKNTPKIIQDFLSDRIFKKNLLSIMIMAIVTGFTFFLINFQMKYIEGDIFINTIVSTCSEMAGYLVSGLIYGKLGPRLSFIAAYAFSVAGALIYIFLGEIYTTYIPIMILMTKLGVAASVNMLYLVNNVFPSQHKSSLLGNISCLCTFSSAIASQVAELKKPYPMISFCVMGILACISTLFINDKTQQNIKINEEKEAKIQIQ